MLKRSNEEIVISKNDIDIIQERLNNVTTDVIKNVNQTCANQISVNHLLNLSGIKVSGNVNIGTSGTPDGLATDEEKDECIYDIEQEGLFTFRCANISEVTNNIASKMVDEIMTNMVDKSSDDVIEQINKKLDDTDNKNEDEEIIVINKYKQVTEKKRKIQDIIKQNISLTFKDNYVASCISQVNVDQGMNLAGSEVRGDINMCNYTSGQVLKTFTECVNTKNATSELLSKIIKSMDVTVKENVEEEEGKKEEEKEEEPEKSFLDKYKIYIIIVASLCCCCCFFIVILIVAMFAFMGGSDNGSELDVEE